MFFYIFEEAKNKICMWRRFRGLSEKALKSVPVFRFGGNCIKGRANDCSMFVE
jgi:hypothetical protein